MGAIDNCYHCHVHKILQATTKKNKKLNSVSLWSQETVNCVPKLFDTSFGRNHEAHCARRTIRCYLRSRTDKWSSLRSKFAQKMSNRPHRHSLFTNNATPFQLLYEAIYVEYRMTWLIFEIAKYGSWTKCWFLFLARLYHPRIDGSWGRHCWGVMKPSCITR